MSARRRPLHPVVTLLALSALLAIVGVAASGVGFCLAWVGDLAWSAAP